MRWYITFVISIATLLVSLISDTVTPSRLEFKAGLVTICPGTTLDPVLAFQSPDCHTTPAHEIDPFDKRIWVKGILSIDPNLLTSGGPLGLYFSAKASSMIYLNGMLLHRNGVPGEAAALEKPGKLDTVIFLPSDIIRPGDNELAVLMSGHSSYMKSSHSVLTVMVSGYYPAPFHERGNYLTAITTLGAFLLGAVYFGIIGYYSQARLGPLTLSCASLFAALQLLIETMRSIWAYPYPVHDLRLLLMCLFSAGAGSMIALHTFNRFKIQHQYLSLICICGFIIAGWAFIPSFDGKVVWGMGVPILASAIASTASVRNAKVEAWYYIFVFTAFSGLIIIDPSQFLDSYYYFALMGLLVYLFIQQAIAFQKSIKEHQQAEASRRQLESALEKIEGEVLPHYLTVKSSGRHIRINADDISVVSSADGYVAIRLIGGREILDDTSLAKMQEELPGRFLSVHRSHIVNLNEILELKRLPSGTGELRLKDNHIVPVSRRIMPQIREVFVAKP